MKVVLLGTGTPNAEPTRAGPATAVTVDGLRLIFDCGPGVVRQAARAYDAGVEEMDPAGLSHLLVSHLHSDHTAGLPDILLTPWTLGREEPLRVWGPPGTERMVRLVEEAWSADVRASLGGDEPALRSGCRALVSKTGPGPVLTTGSVSVSAFAVRHCGMPALGYRVDGEEGSVVISGDTAPFSKMEEAYRGADLLVHEAYSATGLRSRPRPWRLYHGAAHTAATELGELAARVKPKLLVLTHVLPHGEPEERLLAELKEGGWKGPSVLGRDLDVFELPL
mgnify:CR=1 FL=1